MGEVVEEVKHRRPNRTASIEPRWLVSMLNEWTKQFLSGSRSGLGYPMQDAYLTLVRVRPESTGGVGYSEYSSSDFDAVDEAIKRLRDERHELFAVLMMYYRPWMRDHFISLGYPTGNKTFYNRLHDAHTWLVPILESVEKRQKIVDNAINYT